MDVQPVVDVDPFDLPEWLGEAEVTWTPEVGVRTGHLVTGRLSADDRGAHELACDLLARVLYPPAGLPVGLVTALSVASYAAFAQTVPVTVSVAAVSRLTGASAARA